MNESKEALAKVLFLDAKFSRSQIAESLDLKINQVEHMITKGSWRELLKAQQITRSDLLQEAYKCLDVQNQKLRKRKYDIDMDTLKIKQGILDEIKTLQTVNLTSVLEICIDILQYFTASDQKVPLEHMKILSTYLSTYRDAKLKEQDETQR